MAGEDLRYFKERFRLLGEQRLPRYCEKELRDVNYGYSRD